MGAFEDFMDDAFTQSRDVIDEERFQITGSPFDTPMTVSASWNELGTMQEIAVNGKVVTFSAMLLVAVTEFKGKTPAAGQKVTRLKNGTTFRIVGEIHRDGLTFTFPLQTVHQ